MTHLLTAAHCVKIIINNKCSEQLALYYALFATNDRNQWFEQHRFLQVEVHPAYDLTSDIPHNNIAIITVNWLICILTFGCFKPKCDAKSRV